MKTTLKFSTVFLFSLFCGFSAIAQDNPIADFTVPSPYICWTEPAQFIDLSTDPNGHTINSWLWSFGDGNTSALQNPVHIYSIGGIFTVSLIVGNDVGGSDTSSMIVYADGMLSLSINSNNTTCAGSCNGVVTGTAMGGTSPYTYLWGTGFVGLPYPNLCPGTYSLTVTDSWGCSTATSITIMAPPPLTGNIETSQCVDSTGLGWASALVSGGVLPYLYMWSTGASTQSIYSLNPAVYTVTVVDANGCMLALADTVTNNYCDINMFGYVYNDLDDDCLSDPGEGMGGILVYTDPGPYYAVTNNSGYYHFFLNPGTYNIYTVNSAYYETECPVQGFQTVTIINTDDTIPDINLGLHPGILCPLLNVSVATGFLRPCFPSTVYVGYMNTGTAESTDPYVEVILDNDLNYTGSSIPYASVNGNIYTFELDTLDIYESGNFIIYVDVTCDISLIGHTRCVEAHIFPDSICTPVDTLWDHSSVMVTGSCVGDSSACFFIINTGDAGTGDMQNSNEYRIFANDTLVFTGTFQLNGQDSIEICWPSNGRAIRLEADQHPMHPGNSHPQETIEDCGDYTGSSLGFITSNTYNDDDSFIDIYCMMLTGSYDPNEKIVFPQGITSFHYVDNETVLNYQINFQNTGTDTAFTVVIRDTLSDEHDLATFQNGVSSHPCTFNISGGNVLEWTFNNILLPDSNVNEPASHGFVTYTVAQKPMTAGDYGTHILNNAGIYFDFNPPVITNTTDLIFWELPLIITHQPENITGENNVKIYPNPVSGILNIESSVDIEEISLIDITGKNVMVLRNSGKSTSLDLRDMENGLYFIHITDANGTVKVSKILKN